MLRINPELQRNMWLELSIHRLVAMPVTLGLMFFIVYLNGFNFSHVGNVAAIAFFLLCCTWGVNLASYSISSEIKEHTWDITRMSALSPWTVVWGKLFGATIFTWYGGLICLGVYLFAKGISVKNIEIVSIFILVGILSQAAAMFMRLNLISSKSNNSETSSLGLTSLIVIISAYATAGAYAAFNNSDLTVNWFYTPYKLKIFLLINEIVWLFWILFGNYQLMRMELRMRNTPIAWILFCIFCAIYVTGYPDVQERPEFTFKVLAHSTIAYFTVIALNYVAVISGSHDPMTYHRALINFKRGNIWRALQDVPAWLGSLSLAIIICVWITGYSFLFLEVDQQINQLWNSVMLILVFLMRDTSIFIFFNMTAGNNRSTSTSLFYLFILYVVVPYFFVVLGLHHLAGLFFPVSASNSALSIFIVTMAEILVISYMIALRWNALFTLHKSTEPNIQVTAS
ncbi:hypothetical protein TI04_05975 [Achromatium sp. WMS2]|nr:hypothetical protein TI04_05975 [Achromatium sp. WMS2]